MNTNDSIKPEEGRSWEKVIMRYNHPELRKSIWQIFNSVVPYIFMWYLMYRSLNYSYVITLLLSVVASGFLIRIFIIFHDCGHGAFFSSRKANEAVGMIMGIIAFTPYYKWHQQHKIHHATAGNLDKRGIGDVWTMTVDEYRNSSRWTRFFYRSFRNPFILFSIGPLVVILIQNRTSQKNMTKHDKLAHIAGLWLFYIQHQFDETSWERDPLWDYKTAAIKNCSYLKLPTVLQWFTGNIGFHHVHHLSPRIPNYNLERCHFENEIFREIKPVYLLETFRALRLSLWDESTHTMISFRRLFSPHKSAKPSF